MYRPGARDKKTHGRLSEFLSPTNQVQYDPRAMSDSAPTQSGPMFTAEESARLRAVKLTAKHFGAPKNAAEKQSRAAWEAKKAARKTKQ